MDILDVNGVKVEIYETGEQMTMKRYNRFNKYLMIHNEVGSDFGEFDSRLVKPIQFFKKGLKDEGVKALQNFRLPRAGSAATPGGQRAWPPRFRRRGPRVRRSGSRG